MVRWWVSSDEKEWEWREVALELPGLRVRFVPHRHRDKVVVNVDFVDLDMLWGLVSEGKGMTMNHYVLFDVLHSVSFRFPELVGDEGAVNFVRDVFSEYRNEILQSIKWGDMDLEGMVERRLSWARVDFLSDREFEVDGVKFRVKGNRSAPIVRVDGVSGDLISNLTLTIKYTIDYLLRLYLDEGKDWMDLGMGWVRGAEAVGEWVRELNDDVLVVFSGLGYMVRSHRVFGDCYRSWLFFTVHKHFTSRGLFNSWFLSRWFGEGLNVDRVVDGIVKVLRGWVNGASVDVGGRGVDVRFDEALGIPERLDGRDVPKDYKVKLEAEIPTHLYDTVLLPHIKGRDHKSLCRLLSVCLDWVGALERFDGRRRSLLFLLSGVWI